jgi:hypothetical protein
LPIPEIAMKPVSVRTLVASDDASTGPTRMTRARGAVLMVLGPVLAVGMLAVLSAIGAELWNGTAADGSAMATGTREQDLATLVLLVWVCALGVLFTWGGWNLWHRGRLGRPVAVPAAVLVAGLFAATPWLRGLFA